MSETSRPAKYGWYNWNRVRQVTRASEELVSQFSLFCEKYLLAMDLLLADLLHNVTPGTTFAFTEVTSANAPSKKGQLDDTPLHAMHRPSTHYFRPWETAAAAVIQPSSEHLMSAGTSKTWERSHKQSTLTTVSASPTAAARIGGGSKHETTPGALPTCRLPAAEGEGDGVSVPPTMLLPASLPWALGVWYAFFMQMQGSCGATSPMTSSSPLLALPVSSAASPPSSLAPDVTSNGHSPVVAMDTKQQGKKSKKRHHQRKTELQRSRLNRTLEPRAVCLLKDWFTSNLHHPYPDTAAIAQLIAGTGLSRPQIKKWMANRRARSGHVFTTTAADVTTTSDHSHQYDDVTRPSSQATPF